MDQKIQTEKHFEGGLDVTNISNDSYAVFDRFEPDGAHFRSMPRVASGSSGGSIQIHLDANQGH